MNCQPKIGSLAMLVMCWSSLATNTLYAQFQLSWHTIDGGSGYSLGGTFELSGTIGQVDAGVMSGGSYELNGGFWAAAQEPILLGDVNLLVVAPFVDRISTGTFQAEADINQDGVVNLLDVQPFVDLLSS